MPERDFIIFWILLLFYSEFSCPGRVWTEFGTKFFFFFFGLSHPVLAKNNAGEMYFNFFNFFRNFLARVKFERNLRINFFFLFFILSHPVLAKNKAGKRYFNFLNFFTIFFRIFLPRSSINGIRDSNFFPLFRHISSRFG